MRARPTLLQAALAVVTLASLLVALLPSGVAGTRSGSSQVLLRRCRGALSGFLTSTSGGAMHRSPSPRSLGIVHAFAGLAIDRSRTVELKTPSAFEAALRRDDSTFVLFHGTAALVKYPDSAAASGGAAAPAVAHHTAQDLAARLGITIENMLPRPDQEKEEAITCVALGAGGTSGDAQWVFALDVSAKDKETVEIAAAAAGGAAGGGMSRVAFEPVRGLMAAMAGADIAVCGQGAAILAWHRLNQHCGVCGSPMLAVEAGGRRACTSCRNRAYPRVDPVCIALVYDAATDRCLLGRQRVYRPGMYSCLAGYVEQCESLEEAVRREVKEESGVDVGKVLFHSSQPWPIGRGASCQLMVGFICEATSVGISMDSEELEDVRWFSRAEVAAAKELVVTPLTSQQPPAADGSGSDGDNVLSIPGPYAIAHHLIRHWLQMPPRHRL